MAVSCGIKHPSGDGIIHRNIWGKSTTKAQIKRQIWREFKKKRFYPHEIRSHGTDLPAWHKFVRRREFEMVMEAFPPGTCFHNALELGAGDGGQSETIARFCELLTCTELSVHGNEFIGRFETRQLPNASFKLLDSRDLSEFGDGTFDFVFSSNMLEHVDGVTRCLAECRRVLSPDGIMVHTMPTRHWKAWNTLVSIFLKRQRPPVHGISSSHWQEWQAFAMSTWSDTLKDSGFEIFKLVGLPFYFGHGPRPIWLLHLGNRLKWSGTIAYFARIAK